MGHILCKLLAFSRLCSRNTGYEPDLYPDSGAAGLILGLVLSILLMICLHAQ